MWGDRQLCFCFKEDIKNLTSGVIGDPVKIYAEQFMPKMREAYIFVRTEDEVTATGDPDITFSVEYADNEDFDNAVEVQLSGVWKKGDFNGKSGRPCPNMSFPTSPYPWMEPKDVYYRLKIKTDAALACTGPLTASISLDPDSNA